MLVYQALLLGGYAYAHRLSREAPRKQAIVHLVVLLVAASWLPLGLVSLQPPADGSPIFWVPWLLVASIGPLFFAVAAQAPLNYFSSRQVSKYQRCDARIIPMDAAAGYFSALGFIGRPNWCI